MGERILPIGLWIAKENLLGRLIGGHFNLGPITVYGRNAMHFAVNIRTRRWGYICFRLPLRCFDHWWPLYLYVSPNGTPWAATWIVGGGSEGRKRRQELQRGQAHAD